MSKTVLYKESQKIRCILNKYVSLYQKDYTESLKGACAVASVRLVKNLRQKYKMKKLQICVGVYKDDPFITHTWVESKDYLIDITYTQFNELSPEVVLISKKSNDYYRYRNKFEDIKNKNSYNAFKYWGGQENPKYWNKIIKALPSYLLK